MYVTMATAHQRKAHRERLADEKAEHAEQLVHFTVLWSILTGSKSNLNDRNPIISKFLTFTTQCACVSVSGGALYYVIRTRRSADNSGRRRKANWPSPRPRRPSWTGTLDVFLRRCLIFCVCFIVRTRSHAHDAGGSLSAGAERGWGERRVSCVSGLTI